MKILGISTSTPRGSVALVDRRRILGRVAYEGEMFHAERLFGALDQLLGECAAARSDLDAVACDVGPGSFTGVRAGLAAAKGIALSLEVPLVPVQSLEAMAAAAWTNEATQATERLACLLDAKRKETFFAVYDRALSTLAGPGHIASDHLLEALGAVASLAELLLVGEQADRLGLDGHRVLATDDCRLPDAVWIARGAVSPLERADLQPVEAVQAVYLRAPDAIPSRQQPPTKRG